MINPTYGVPQQFIMLTEGQLREIIEDAVSRAFAKAMDKQDDKYWDKHRTMEFLHCKKTKLWQLIKDGYLHPTKIGNKDLFNPDEVKSLINS